MDGYLNGGSRELGVRGERLLSIVATVGLGSPALSAEGLLPGSETPTAALRR